MATIYELPIGEARNHRAMMQHLRASLHDAGTPPDELEYLVAVIDEIAAPWGYKLTVDGPLEDFVRKMIALICDARMTAICEILRCERELYALRGA